ncbi:MAG: efflux RND transporter periplasmic adaptor subunit [Myxococcota bacterium]
MAAGIVCALLASWWSPAVAQTDGVDVAAPAPGRSSVVTAIGRLEPKNGLTRVAGPSDLVVVVQELRVNVGDPVKAGEVIAILDTVASRRATLARARAEFANAERELARQSVLSRSRVVSESDRDAVQLRVDVGNAEVRHAEAELERALVRSPIDGQVVEVHARDGERVGPDGIVEIGPIDEMYAIAEVYETDIGRVELGQRARVTSPAFSEPLYGVVDEIGLKVGKADALGTDPAARTDARVIEVDIRLDDGQRVAGLTNLQVEVEIGLTN